MASVILARFLGEINQYFHILGGVATIRLMILKYKILVCQKNLFEYINF